MPYLHPKRHAHAMKRPRGPSGRFLPKPDDDAVVEIENPRTTRVAQPLAPSTSNAPVQVPAIQLQYSSNLHVNGAVLFDYPAQAPRDTSNLQ